LSEFGIKENKVEFREADFLRKLRKWKNKVLKKTGISVDWIFGGYRGVLLYSLSHKVTVNAPANGTSRMYGIAKRP